jgi:glycosyltransferase involved in cell wall biosynthesis
VDWRRGVAFPPKGAAVKVAIDARAVTEHPSGVGVYTRTLISALAEHDGQNSYCVMANHRLPFPRNFPANIQIVDDAFPIGNLWLQIRCPALLRRNRVDVFHGANFLAPLFAPCPTVLTVHDLSSHIFPNMHTRRNNLVQRLLPAAIRRAALVIAISESTKRDLIERMGMPEAKIRVVHNAIPPGFARVDDAQALARAKKRRRLPDRFFLFVGTLEPRKNIPRLLDAYARFLRGTNSGAYLVLADDNGWGARKVLEHHGRLGLGERVRFLGYIEHDELPALYTLARAAVMPSVYEGFGLPAVEAMACGTPLIAADNSGLAEVAGDAALRFPFDDVARLAELMTALDCDDDLCARHATKGLERAKSFSAAAFARATLAVYREAVEKR